MNKFTKTIKSTMFSPSSPKHSIKVHMVEINGREHFIFDNEIFHGNGMFSEWKCKQLKKQIGVLFGLQSGLQQGGLDKDSKKEFEFLKKNVVTALDLI